MPKYYSGITTGPTLDSMLAIGSEFGIFPRQDIDCANINASGIHTVGGFLYPNGGIKDSSNSTGTSGKVLSSTGSGLAWIDPSEGSTTNAINVGTNLNSTNSDQFVAFMGASSGNNPVRVDAGVKYNPSTNILKVGNVELPNLGEFSLGDNQELKMFHKDDTSDVRVEVGSGTNYILLTKNFDLKNAAGNKAAITANDPGGVPEVRLHHDGNERLKTTDDGVTITGDLTVTDIIANGNIDLGSDGNDTLTVSAKVDSDIIPSGTTRDLGSNANRWRNLYAKTIKDKDNESGTSGQVLSSTGTELDWINIGDVAAGSAAQVAVSDESSDTTCFPLFVTGATGNQSPKSGSNLTFNSDDGTLSATTFSGSGASLTSIPAGQLTGTVADARISTLTASKLSGALPAIDGSNLTGLSDNDTTYELKATRQSNGGTSGTDTDPYLFLNASSGTDDSVRLVGSGSVSVTRSGDGQITISGTDTNTDTQLSTEQVQDIVGGMVSGNTESGITVTYDDAGAGTGKLNFSVGTLNQNTTGSAAKLTTARTIAGVSFDGTSNITLDNANITNGAGYITATLTNEQVQDIVGGMVSGNTESGITVTYQDSDGTIDFSVASQTDQNFTTTLKNKLDGIASGATNVTNNNQLTNGAGYVTAANAFPSGGIIIWSGAVNQIPTGWVLCDGNNSTPDLRDRFIVGAGTGGSYSPGNTGGAASVTLSVAQMPSHSHSTNSHAHSFSGSGSHSHVLPVGRGGSQSNISGYIAYDRVEQVQNNLSTQSASVTVSGTTGGESPNTNPDGGGGSHENRPPYYALCYIMKT